MEQYINLHLPNHTVRRLPIRSIDASGILAQQGPLRVRIQLDAPNIEIYIHHSTTHAQETQKTQKA